MDFIKEAKDAEFNDLIAQTRKVGGDLALVNGKDFAIIDKDGKLHKLDLTPFQKKILDRIVAESDPQQVGLAGKDGEVFARMDIPKEEAQRMKQEYFDQSNGKEKAKKKGLYLPTREEAPVLHRALQAILGTGVKELLELLGILKDARAKGMHWHLRDDGFVLCGHGTQAKVNLTSIQKAIFTEFRKEIEDGTIVEIIEKEKAKDSWTL